MKSCVFLLMGALLVINANSQVSQPDNAIGYYFDNDHNFIQGYVDNDYDPASSLFVKMNSEEDYTPGYYYNLQNQKINGFIKYDQSKSRVHFKKTPNGDDVKMLPEECKALVIGLDSFIVLSNFPYENKLGRYVKNKPDFVEVVDRFDNMTLYKSVSDANVVSYMIKKDGSNEFTTFPHQSYNFKKASSSFFTEFNYLTERIKKGEFSAYTVPVMFKMLEYYRIYSSGDKKVRYNKYWDETDNKEEYFYYADIQSIHDSVFHLKYFQKDGVPLFEGDFTSFYPSRQIGTTIYYYPDGTIRKKIIFEKNKPETIEYYFENGKPHIIIEVKKKGVKYAQVFDENGKNILDDKGSGEEILFDALTKRDLNITYKKHEIESSWFLDQNGNKIYQYCSSQNPYFLLSMTIKDNLKKEFSNLNASEFSNEHGRMIVKINIGTDGMVSEISNLKGLSSAIDERVLKVLNLMRTKRAWNPGIANREKVITELILPIDISISSYSYFRTNNYNYMNDYFMHQWMQQQMNYRPPTPTYRGF